MAKRKTITPSSRNVFERLSLSLKEVSPLTDNQRIFWENYNNGKQKLLLGYPGTGKSYIALYKALEDIQHHRHKRVVIVRSAVSTRDIGFLPGNEAEKSSVYTLPYKKILSEHFGRDDAYEILEKNDLLRFMLTSYVRGLSIDNSVVILDEFQNMTAHEADSIITRLGTNSKIVICGDLLQRDFTKAKERDIEKFLTVVDSMTQDFDKIYFTLDDIVRSGIVKAYIEAKHRIFEEGF